MQGRRLSDWGAGVAWADLEDDGVVPYIAISAGVVIDATKFRFDQDVQNAISSSDYKDGRMSPVTDVWAREIQAKISLIEAAKVLGVPRYIYFAPKISSVTELDELTQSNLIEEYLIQSGLNYTIVTFECHFLGTLWDTLSVLKSGTEEPILRVRGGKSLSLVSKEDLAKAACLAIFSKRCERTRVWVRGPRSWPPLESAKFVLARVGEEVTRLKPVNYFYVTVFSYFLSLILSEWPKVHKLKIYTALISNGITRRPSSRAMTFDAKGKKWIYPSKRSYYTPRLQGVAINGGLLRLLKLMRKTAELDSSASSNSRSTQPIDLIKKNSPYPLGRRVYSEIQLPLIGIHEGDFQTFEDFMARDSSAYRYYTQTSDEKTSKTRTKATDEPSIL
jgi:hypothetical protein